MRCVLAQYFTVSKALSWRSAIEEKPPYQRESAVWSLDKQQLFIDSLLNGYDVPKIYLHDLRGKHPTKVYAVVDGKQRLTTIWEFLTDGFALAPEFRIDPNNVPEELPADAVTPAGALRFSSFDPHWQKFLRDTYLSVVLIKNATEEDIEDLFSRLNNGEPLNAAEKRNAMGGDVAKLIREVAKGPFFAERLHFSNARHHQYDLAARLLVIEHARRGGAAGLPDLRSSALDTFVRDNKKLDEADRSALLAAVIGRLDRLAMVFGPSDPLLSAPTYALLYYLFVDAALGPDASHDDGARLRDFLEWFQQTRLAELDRSDGERDAALIEYSGLMQHGANDQRNIDRRLEILRIAHDRRVGESADAA